MKPNLVLLNVGTNDCIQNIDTANAGVRTKQLIDDIFNSVPGITVILSTLLPGRDFDACASSVSQQYRNLTSDYAKAGAKLHLADMHNFLTVGEGYPSKIRLEMNDCTLPYLQSAEEWSFVHTVHNDII